MTDPTSESPAIETPKWLKHLQENSWEAEILISGGAIFSLFQLVDYLIATSEHVSEVMPFLGHQEMLMTVVLVLRGVTIGFLCHLFLRGFWIALVCLRSAYPSGINFSRLHVKGRYLKQANEINLTAQIVRLDKASGLIFFGSFLFILILVGFLILFLVIVYLLFFFQPNYSRPSFIKSLLFYLYLIYLFDFVTAGLLRRNTTIGNLFFPIYWLFDILSLGFIYRPYLQILFTNINKWKSFLFITLLSISASLSAFISLEDHFGWRNPFDKRPLPKSVNEIFKTDGFYQDRIAGDVRVEFACIQSELVRDEFLMVFIPYKADYAEDIAEAKKKLLTEIVSIAIDDSTVNEVEWLYDDHKGQFGISANLPISQLAKGKHVLQIQIGSHFFYFGKDKLKIPFWKE